MALYMIGIGLNDAKDITVKGLDIVRACHYVYLETYTSLLACSVEDLEELYGKRVIDADREFVERHAEKILDRAKEADVAFLVVGDVFAATTHTDLMLRAKRRGIDVKTVNNASVINAVGCIGLEIYKYGKVTSIPYPEKGYNPLSFYDVLSENQKIGAHTLMLLDIKADQARFMTVKEGLHRLIEAENKYKTGLITEHTQAIGIARLGGTQKIVFGLVNELQAVNFGPPPHAIIIPGALHFMEEEALMQWSHMN